MVKVFFGLPEEEIISTSKYFNNSYTEEWLDEWAKRVIQEIDHSELISDGLVLSPVLGSITIREISGGAKALITMNADETVISNANSCGDNCASLLAELSRKKDFSVFLAYPMNLRGLNFDMEIARTGHICHTAKEFEKEYLLWRQNMILLLQHDMFRKVKEIQKTIQNLDNMADTRYASPERYCAELLAFITRNTPAQYTKSKLNECYTKNCCYKASFPCW